VRKAALRAAQSRGQVIDERILDIPAVARRPREGRALTVEQLYELSSWFPEHAKRLVLVAGMVGARQHFWFGLTDRMIDLDAATMDSPAALQKNRRAHRVYLTPIEVTLLREQLLARAKGVRLVFPSPRGKTWTRHHFRDRVWVPALEAAVKDNDTFAGFTFHLLRHTAGSLMALGGMEPPVAAERLGHTDGGALFLRTYRHLYEDERRGHAKRFGEFVKGQLEPVTDPQMDKRWTGAP
jgi:integrase